ncbi:hypothetical protein M513_12975, partial [Trichuris suis]
CVCNASYIGETGNTLFPRFDQHMSNVLTYKNAERRQWGTYDRPRTSTENRTWKGHGERDQSLRGP